MWLVRFWAFSAQVHKDHFAQVPLKAEPETRACAGQFIWGHDPEEWRTEKANKEREKLIQGFLCWLDRWLSGTQSC